MPVPTQADVIQPLDHFKKAREVAWPSDRLRAVRACAERLRAVRACAERLREEMLSAPPVRYYSAPALSSLLWPLFVRRGRRQQERIKAGRKSSA